MSAAVVVEENREQGSREGRWHGRPVLSASLVVLAHALPIGAAVATSAFLSRRLTEPDGLGDKVGQWALLFAASTLVLLIVDRGAKRLLPLAALLKLSMLFPDAAPKRLTVARKSGSVRNLQHRLDEAKSLGADDQPKRAAEVILALVGALHAHDRHTRGHSERVRWFTDLLAEELKLPPADRDRLRWAALLHDIGKLQIPTRVLNKPGKLVRREWRHIHRHPEAGARIVAPLAPWLGEWSAAIEQHHEKYDGSGYPRGLKGDEISLGARIVAVADAYEVMTAVRSYKKAASAATARKELTRSAGTHFDPAIVRAFLNVSIGRLRWVSGPVAWVAQIPFVGWVPRLAEGAAAVSGQAAGAAGAVGTAAVLSGGSTFVVSSEDVNGTTPATEVVVDTDVANPVGLLGDITPTTVATRVLSEVLTRKEASTTPPAPAPAPAPVVETHDNPSTNDDKVVEPTTDTTVVRGNGNGNGNGVPGPSSKATPASNDPGQGLVDELTKPLKGKK